MITTSRRHSRLALAIFSTLPGMAFASSFQLLEQSPAHLGTAFAGTASNVMDASSVFFNPAGISQLEGRHFTLAGNLVFTESTFHDQGSNTNGVESTTDETGVIPNVYYVNEYISKMEEKAIIKAIYQSSKPWAVLKNRRLQNWGGTPHPGN